MTYIDADGSPHVIGLADIRIQAEDQVRTKGAVVLSVDTLILSLLKIGEGTGVFLGYDAITLVSEKRGEPQ